MDVVDVNHECIAVDEANKLGIPVIGVVDTNLSYLAQGDLESSVEGTLVDVEFATGLELGPTHRATVWR